MGTPSVQPSEEHAVRSFRYYRISALSGYGPFSVSFSM